MPQSPCELSPLLHVSFSWLLLSFTMNHSGFIVSSRYFHSSAPVTSHSTHIGMKESTERWGANGWINEQINELKEPMDEWSNRLTISTEPYKNSLYPWSEKFPHQTLETRVIWVGACSLGFPRLNIHLSFCFELQWCAYTTRAFICKEWAIISQD